MSLILDVSTTGDGSVLINELALKAATGPSDLADASMSQPAGHAMVLSGFLPIFSPVMLSTV